MPSYLPVTHKRNQLYDNLGSFVTQRFLQTKTKSTRNESEKCKRKYTTGGIRITSQRIASVQKFQAARYVDNIPHSDAVFVIFIRFKTVEFAVAFTLLL